MCLALCCVLINKSLMIFNKRVIQSELNSQSHSMYQYYYYYNRSRAHIQTWIMFHKTIIIFALFAPICTTNGIHLMHRSNVWQASTAETSGAVRHQIYLIDYSDFCNKSCSRYTTGLEYTRVDKTTYDNECQENLNSRFLATVHIDCVNVTTEEGLYAAEFNEKLYSFTIVDAFLTIVAQDDSYNFREYREARIVDDHLPSHFIAQNLQLIKEAVDQSSALKTDQRKVCHGCELGFNAEERPEEPLWDLHKFTQNSAYSCKHYAPKKQVVIQRPSISYGLATHKVLAAEPLKNMRLSVESAGPSNHCYYNFKGPDYLLADTADSCAYMIYIDEKQRRKWSNGGTKHIIKGRDECIPAERLMNMTALWNPFKCTTAPKPPELIYDALGGTRTGGRIFCAGLDIESLNKRYPCPSYAFTVMDEPFTIDNVSFPLRSELETATRDDWSSELLFTPAMPQCSVSKRATRGVTTFVVLSVYFGSLIIVAVTLWNGMNKLLNGRTGWREKYRVNQHGTPV